MTLLEPTPQTARFPVGSLVHARGRDWVVLPSDDVETMRLRPLGGSEEDAVGLYLPLEGDDVRSSSIEPPDLTEIGDASSAALLREAARLGFRAAAGPMRSLGRIAVEPRPYQLVPLLMALRLDPVRLLIGDDVGVGKTIEAALVARELVDRGEIRRIAVLCPPHLCEQWQVELRDKFHLNAVVVRPGTVARLERDLDLSRSVFDEYPFVVVSIDYIKSDRRRDDFVRACPELVIVDEAHTAARPRSMNTAQHHRHRLLADIASSPTRHLILTTATPHSGDESAFASLIGLLDPDLEEAVATLDFGAGTQAREQLARHFVQRRRGDVRAYLGEDTPFPGRQSSEHTYRLGQDYQRLMQRVLNYAHEIVKGAEGMSRFQQRVHWWAALALLRCVSSSPAAAATALRTRAPLEDQGDARAADRLAAGLVLDLDLSDEATQDDSTPGADTVAAEEPTATERRRLMDLARTADELRGAKDPKLAEATRIVTEMVSDGFQAIVFCRYIATAEYVAEELAKRLKGVEVRAVTGKLPPEEREDRVLELSGFPKRVLVATDCLSEGINLQQHFDAVLHYDLSWNPTRHEQREGRVDRYGQPSKDVRTALLYGQDNRVDGAVLKVLLRKADTIRKQLGVSVPVPVDSNAVLEAMFESLFLRREPAEQLQLDLGLEQAEREVSRAWEHAADRERRTRTIFAQHAIRASEVEDELKDARKAIGSARDVEWFVRQAASRLEAPMVESRRSATWDLDVTRLPQQVLSRADLLDPKGPLLVTFDLPAADGVAYLARTHPLVESLSGYMLDTALDQSDQAVAKRAGAIRTEAVQERTILLVLRSRYLIHEQRGSAVLLPMLAEETLLVAFRGTPDSPGWLEELEVEQLVRGAQPIANVQPGQATAWLLAASAALPSVQDGINAAVKRRAEQVLEMHRRVRLAANVRGVRQRIEPHLPPDLLGLYVFMPPPVAAGVGGR